MFSVSVCLKWLYCHILTVAPFIQIPEKLSFYSITTVQTMFGFIMARCSFSFVCPDSKVRGANMGPIWGRQDPGVPHVGTMNFAIWVHIASHYLHELIWKQWTYTILARYILSSMCLRLIFSIILQYITWACVSSANPFSFDYCEDIITSSYHYHQLGKWIINHCVGLGYGTMICTARLALFLTNR